MRKGKHRTRTARYIATTSLGLTGLALTPGIAHAAPQEAWDAVAQCESGGRNIESASPASTASGYFQIIDGTWAAFGGLEYAPRAIDATYEQQLTVAERVLASQGPTAWVNGCGDPLVGQPVAPEAPPVEEAPHVEEVPAPTVTVQAGDTLVGLFGADWRRVAQLNGILDPWVIHPGQVLITEDPVHVVVEGETLSGIALQEATTVEQLVTSNPDVIEDPDLIYPGEELVVVRMTSLPPVPAPLTPPAEPAAPGVVRPVTGPVGDSLGAGRGHDGVDLGCEIGDPVKAALGGVVQATRTYDGGQPYTGYGLVVDVIGWDGALYRYAHLSEIYVAPGEPVASGEVIATCGSTGQSTGSHLHFERRPSGELYGTPDDPAAWLVANGV